MSGWVKLHRSLAEWEWYADSKSVHLFLHLLIKANHKPSKYRGQYIERGQVLTGRKQLSAETGLSEQSVRTVLTRLKSTSEITIKSTSKFSIITVCNYDKYQGEENDGNQQDNQQANQQVTNGQPATNHIQECKKNKEEKETKKKKVAFAPPSVSEVDDYCAERKNNISAQVFVDFYESKGWMIGRNKMKSWKAAVRTWEQKDKGQSKLQTQTSLFKGNL